MNTGEKLNTTLWVKNYENYLYFHARKRVKDMEIAKDLVQETFLSALEKAYTFEGRCNERTWLMTILGNKIIDYYRKRSSGMNSLIDSCGLPLRPDYYTDDEQDGLTRKEFYIVLDRCIKKLPEVWMTVFRMKHLEEMKADVICRELQISAANYWVISHRAKLRVREYLQDYWNAPVA